MESTGAAHNDLPASDSTRPVRRALLSVSDKRGLEEFARGLHALGVEIVSTGGTARALREAGIPITEIDAFTGFPEMLDGRVKTLHPRVHGGILFRRDDPSHVRAMEDAGMHSIDLVAVNLYPFEETVARPGVTRCEAVEQIDIGGPSMIRSAAKNHADVTVVCSPDLYSEVLAEMQAHGGATTPALRKRLALEAFRRTASYDAAISRYFEEVDREDAEPAHAAGGDGGAPPERFEISLGRSLELRYGENPHQQAALYGNLLEHFEKLHGKDLSYNNILDLVSAQELAERLSALGTAAVIVKHMNPCGAAVSAGDGSAALVEAWRKALATDSQSASGSIIALSAPVDEEVAAALAPQFIEVLAAPGFTPGALSVLRKKKNRILLEVKSPLGTASGWAFRSVPGGLLLQTPDRRATAEGELRVVTRRAPSQEEMKAMRFAWEVVRSVKSNAIVYAAEDRTLGIGAGQMSRVDSAHIAVIKASAAGLDLKGCAVASDAFFPFPDGLLVAADAGATCAIQPGGSVRDKAVIEAADSRAMAMVCTGARHFRH